MSRQARLGLLVLATVALFVVALFGVTNQSSLLSGTYSVTATFGQVGGLRTGAPVRYRGVVVGTVDDVRLPDQPGAPIRVVLNLERQADHLIRTDTRAQIKSEGVVGKSIVVLTGGSASAPRVEDGGLLTGIDPLDPFEAAGEALGTLARIDSLAAQVSVLLQTVQNGEGSVGKLVNDPGLYDRALALTTRAERTLTELDTQTQALTDRIATTMNTADSLLAKANTGDGTVARLLNDPEAYEVLLRTGRQIEALSLRADTLLTEAEYAAYWATVALYRASENMEALQEHWLFRRFFRNRDDAVPIEIREDALQALRDSTR